MANHTLNQAMEARRSIYAIGKDISVSQKEIQGVIEHALTYVPSAFNGQSPRIVLLFGEAHDRLWGDIVMETLRKIVPAEHFSQTEEKINAFKAGYGTALFFEDTAVTQNLMDQFALYKDNFPVWAQQANGMLQYTIWIGLADIGLGASLQHYNPLIDDQVKRTWKVPGSWKLLAQMPFGQPHETAEPKDKLPMSERLEVFSK
ncbi:MAG: nitroreductase family protein [Sphaerochaeta sp.]|jgi:predicted oxidoreductase (fatty acid repression mutant protein)|nr:nitroreductase family protein [Sphaerochaeta sp.]